MRAYILITKNGYTEKMHIEIKMATNVNVNMEEKAKLKGERESERKRGSKKGGDVSLAQWGARQRTVLLTLFRRKRFDACVGRVIEHVGRERLF